MSTPRVTVIMTHYNQPKFALEAQHSVVGQTFQDWELLLYDDGSAATKQPTIVDDPRIKAHFMPELAPLERKSRTRYAVLNNLGLHAARGGLITYLTQDDLYFPDRLERMVRYMDQHPTCNSCYGPQALWYWENGRWVSKGLRIAPTLVLDPLNVIDHDSVMHRAAVGRQCGGWPEGPEFWRKADGYFFRELIKLGGPLQRIDGYEPTDVHRFHRSNLTDHLAKNELEKAF
jgi:spore maturation protein CgeD